MDTAVSFADIVAGVLKMPLDPETKKELAQYGLDVMNVTWEDTGRSPNSSYGPNISDLTLVCDGGSSPLPVIRPPNFKDITADIPIDRIPIVVGNQVPGVDIRTGGAPLKTTITLKQYLSEIGLFLSKPVPGLSLIAERDTHVLMSAQSCVLPVIPGRETDFHVRLYNYQSTDANPAVLVIVATQNGTSAQVVGTKTTDVYFNLGGQKAPFIAQRLKDYRIEKGDTNTSKDMSADEALENTVMVIQVPLVVPPPPSRSYESSGSLSMYRSLSVTSKSVLQPASFSFGARDRDRDRDRPADMEHAIVKVGDGQGPFPELNGKTIKRDTRYPVRLTLQFYKASSSAKLTPEHASDIALQILNAKKIADRVGSLVTDPNSGRITAPITLQPLAPRDGMKESGPVSFWM